MTSESSDFSAIKSVNIDSFILGPSSDVPIRNKLNAKNAVTVIGFDPFYSIQFDVLAPFGEASLLVGTDHVELSSSLHAGSHIFGSPFFHSGVFREVNLKGFHPSGFACFKLLQNISGVLHLEPLFLYQTFRCYNILLNRVENFLYDASELSFYLL